MSPSLQELIDEALWLHEESTDDGIRRTALLAVAMCKLAETIPAVADIVTSVVRIVQIPDDEPAPEGP